ncbi:hypothetical protein K438DRAFT_2026493 [Mycena galopus ATCC 62051]|nr:hypothetical protein K438DRAFT_2026493 [Mycena galopus ATCC 62051]
MSDPTLCRAKGPDGDQCVCMRAKDTYFDEDTKRTLCQSCGHIESAHPEPKPSVGSFVRGFRDAGKLAASNSLSVKASHKEAEAETSTGLRPKKRKSTTDTEPGSSKKPNKGKAKEKTPKIEGENVKYGKLVFLVCGISEDGTLRNPRVPSAPDMDKMRKSGLVILSTPDHPLFVNTGWNNADTKAHIKKLAPDPIAFLERHPYHGDSGESREIRDQPWLGVIKQGKNLTLAADSLPSGVELADHCRVLGRTAADRVLYLVSKNRIPTKRWDWADSESEELGSEIDPVPSEDIIMTPRKPRPAPKKKIKVKAEPIDPSSGEDDSDMKKAAKMRTRLSTGTLTHKSVVIPGSSDGFEDSTVAAAGSSANPDVVVVSDDDDTLLPPASTLGSTTWDPTPSTLFDPPSPNQDPPTFYDDFAYHFPPADDQFSHPPHQSPRLLPLSTRLLPGPISVHTHLLLRPPPSHPHHHPPSLHLPPSLLLNRGSAGWAQGVRAGTPFASPLEFCEVAGAIRCRRRVAVAVSNIDLLDLALRRKAAFLSALEIRETARAVRCLGSVAVAVSSVDLPWFQPSATELLNLPLRFVRPPELSTASDVSPSPP